MAVQPDFRVKRNDDLITIERIAAFTNGDIQNLTGATVAFRFQLVDQAGALDTAASSVSNGVTSIVDAALGIWSYTFTAPDLAEPAGFYGGELQVSIAGVVQTFPAQGYLYFEIVEEIA